MFDCHHVGWSEGDILTRPIALLPVVGHIRIASVPDRGTPDHGEVDDNVILPEIDAPGWSTPIGAESRPKGPTSDSLEWLAASGNRKGEGPRKPP